MKRDDISDELCSHFRATVHAMTTAMEPGAGEDAKASLRREACSFQELVDQQAVRGSDDVETPGDVPAGADPNVYIKRSSIQGAGGGAFARQQLLTQTELLPHAGFPVSAATLRAGGYPGGYVMRVGAPYIDARDPEGRLVLADGRTVSTHEFTDAEWELLSPVGVRWDGAANLSRFINEASGDAVANVSFSKGRWRTTREVGEHEELLVATYGKDFWRGEEGAVPGTTTAPQTDPELSLDGLEQYRVKNELDIWVVPPDAAAAMLGISVAEQQQCWTELSQQPMRNRSDAIVPCEPQWINGDNEALEMYRHGTRTKRNKMWFQTDDPLAEGFLVYKYTYHQQLVVPATFEVSRCRSLARITSAYNSRICHALGAKEANHGIATAYENGTDCITAHSDKASDIAPSDRGGLSLIGVLKAGENSRPFEIAMDKQSAPFFTKELPPGTLVLMTLEANNRTVHSVPAVPDCGPSGSIVWRTITTRMTTAEVVRELEMRGHGGEKEARPAAIAAYSAAAQVLGSMIEPEVVD